MKPKTDEAAKRIHELFVQSGAYSEEQAREIAFHLTDWIDDLVPFADFLENPRAVDGDKAMDIIVKFLAHAPNHLHAAAERVLNLE
jgi:hypothetical protein